MSSSGVARKIVVVGGGNAAGYFARAVCAAGRGRDLCIISAEPVLPYERPALTKAFLNAESPARLPGFHTSVGGGGERQTQEWYDRHGVEVMLGAAVVSADLPRKTVVTDAGVAVSYDKLVVATGCTALKLPPAIGGDLPGVYYVRSHADALSLYEALGAARPGRVAVVGGGYVGLEVAAACAARGLAPHCILMESHVMSRLWTPAIAERYESLFASEGVVFHKNAKVSRIERSAATGGAEAVALEGGAKIDADVVVVGVGAAAPLGPFEGALDTTDDARNPGGIKVDGSFRASGPDVEPGSVYAIGDVAAFPLLREGGRPTRMEHVAHARRSAAHCAAAVLRDDDADEAPPPYDYLPYFYSRVFEQPGSDRKVAWTFYGSAAKNARVIGPIGDFAPKLAAFWVEEGSDRCVGAMLESGDAEEIAAIEAVAAARPKVDVDALARCAGASEAVALVKKAVE